MLKLPGFVRAKTAANWYSLVRPALLSSILTEEYGVSPATPLKMDSSLALRSVDAFGGKGTVLEVEITCTQPDCKMSLLLITPNGKDRPACFAGLNFHGNHTVTNLTDIAPPKSLRGDLEKTTEQRGSDGAAWPIETILERGYAVATIYNGDVIPDNVTLAGIALKAFCDEHKQLNDGDAPGALVCWAWTLSRVIDFLHSSDLIDSNRIALISHSRNGKAALLAGALDSRPAMLVASQSGTGGAAPCRPIGLKNDKRETVKTINTAFPHWFCSNFKHYNDKPELLPFDQHALIALNAPRPILIASAEDDLWANPSGTLATIVAAAPVYQMLTGEMQGDLSDALMGIVVKSRLGYFIRPGAHSTTSVDWTAWLEYADVWL